MSTPRKLMCALTCLFVLVSCGPDKIDERKHPLFRKAKNLQRRGEYMEAARTFREFISIHPESAISNYELATLYHDHLEDPLMAIYYYRTYIDLSARGGDVELSRQWMEKLEKKYYAKLKEKYGDAGADGKPELKPDVEINYRKHIDRLARENAYLKRRISSSIETRTETAEPATGIDTGGSSAVESARADPEPTPRFGAAKTYRVKTGDTLSRISRKVYGSAKYYKLIYNANRDVLKSESELKIGQELKIPEPPASAD